MQQRHSQADIILEKRSRIRLPVGFSALREDLGDILRRHRTEGGHGSTATVAAAIGISRESLSRIENGRSQGRPQTLDALLGLYDLDWAAIATSGETQRIPRYFDDSWEGEARAERGIALRRGRLSERLSLAEVGRRCGISASQLSRIERGEAPRSTAHGQQTDGAMPARFAHPELRRLASIGTDD